MAGTGGKVSCDEGAVLPGAVDPLLYLNRCIQQQIKWGVRTFVTARDIPGTNMKIKQAHM